LAKVINAIIIDVVKFACFGWYWIFGIFRNDKTLAGQGFQKKLVF
jgi:hypothetical protein